MPRTVQTNLLDLPVKVEYLDWVTWVVSEKNEGS